MAALGYAVHLIPEEVKGPISEFLESGFQQVARVLHGPQARRPVQSTGYKHREPRNISARQGRQQAAIKEPELDPPSFQTEQIQLQVSQQLPGKDKRNQRKRAAAFVAASVPASPLAYSTATPAACSVQLLSDTVHPACPLVRHVFAGTAARTMSQILIHPIDTIKTRLQVNKLTAPLQLKAWRSSSKAQKLSITLGRTRVLSFRNWIVQGPVDLYRGLTGAALGTIPVAMVYFTAYEACKGFMEAQGASGAATHLASASVGAVLSAFIRVPIDTLKHRTQAYIIPNIFQGARSIVSTEGIQGLYHGMLPTLLRDVPELALQFSIYEALRHFTETHRKGQKLRTWEHLVLGGVSGAAAASATMPLDVAKTALQCGHHRSVTLAMQDCIREKGLQALFAGMGPRVMQIALQGAVFFTLFEAWKAKLKPSPQRLEGDRLMAPKLWRKRRDHVWKRQFVIQ